MAEMLYVANYMQSLNSSRLVEGRGGEREVLIADAACEAILVYQHVYCLCLVYLVLVAASIRLIDFLRK